MDTTKIFRHLFTIQQETQYLHTLLMLHAMRNEQPFNPEHIVQRIRWTIRALNDAIVDLDQQIPPFD